MVDPAPALAEDPAVAARFAAALATSDATVASTGPILRHLLRHDDHDLLTDRIVAAVRAQLRDIAFQLIVAVEMAAGHPQPRDMAEETCDLLTDALAAHPVLLGHVHAQALEGVVAQQVSARLGLDPVVSPLLQALIASDDPATAATAMDLVAAQARFGQAQRRGELPLGELAGDLLHTALIVLRTWVGGEDRTRDGYASSAERAIRSGFDEGASRLGLLHRLVAGMGPEPGGTALAALDLAHAGVALFVTALGPSTGYDRDRATLMLSQGQLPRLALALLAGGQPSATVQAQCLALHPDFELPAGLAHLRAASAAALLAATEASDR